MKIPTSVKFIDHKGKCSSRSATKRLGLYWYIRVCGSVLLRSSLVHRLGRNSSDKFLMSTLPILISLADSHLAVGPGILKPQRKNRLPWGLSLPMLVTSTWSQGKKHPLGLCSHWVWPTGQCDPGKIICWQSGKRISATNDLTQFSFFFFFFVFSF